MRPVFTHLAETMTASPSLQRRPGMCLRHCLDSRKRPGKKTEPAAKMLNMVPRGPLAVAKLQQVICCSFPLKIQTSSPTKETRNFTTSGSSWSELDHKKTLYEIGYQVVSMSLPR